MRVVPFSILLGEVVMPITFPDRVFPLIVERGVCESITVPDYGSSINYWRR